MSVDTPAWVRDAIFYQIFPDRFAASERVLKPGDLEPWDAPPTTHGFKGGDLRGVAEQLDYLEDLGITAIYLTPIFQSASNHRYHTYDYFEVDPLLGGDDALRELLDAAHGRGMRVVLDGVFNHTGRGFWPFHHILETGAASPYRDWFLLDARRLDGGRPLLAYPPPGTPRVGPRLRGVVGPAGPAQAQHRQPRGPRVPAPGRRALAPLRDRRLAPRRARRRSTTRRSGRSSAGAAGRSDPTPTSSARSGQVAPEWLRGDRFDALMNYPLGEAILGFAGGPRSTWTSCAGTTTTPGASARWTARRSPTGSASSPRRTTRTSSRSSSTSSARTMRRGCGRSWAATSTGVRLATLLQVTLPGAPCIYYGDEVGLRGGNDPEYRGAFPWDEAPLGARPARLGPGAAPPPHGRAGPARRAAAGRRRRRIRGRLRARRGRGAVRRRGQRGRLRRRTSTSGSATRRTAPAATSRRSTLPGFDGVAAAPIVDGRATLASRPRSGGVLRVV